MLPATDRKISTDKKIPATKQEEENGRFKNQSRRDKMFHKNNLIFILTAEKELG